MAREPRGPRRRPRKKTRVAFKPQRRRSSTAGRRARIRTVSAQVDKEWETHIISLNQNIKDAVAAHKRHRKFVDVMEGRGVGAVSSLSDEPPVVVAGAPEDVSVDVGGEVVDEKVRFAEQEL